MPIQHDEVTKHKKPDWLKIRLHNNEGYSQVAHIVREHGLHTICSSGRCPNQAECWSRRTATFMILGEICTRSCKFCATASGKPLPPDSDEPRKLARSVSLMGLKHCVITSVDRDDLPDGGASHWAASVRSVRESNPDTTIEVLIPDFDGKEELIDIVLASAPDIVGHNIETVERLTPQVRSRAKYGVSLNVLKHIAGRGATAKSGLMLGLGESEAEVLATMDDLLENSTFKSIPQQVMDYQVNQCLNYYSTLAGYYGYDLDGLVQNLLGYESTDAMLAHLESNLEDYAKEALLYQAVAESLDITPTQEQLDAYSDYKDTYGQNYCTMVALMDAVTSTLTSGAVVS